MKNFHKVTTTVEKEVEIEISLQEIMDSFDFDDVMEIFIGDGGEETEKMILDCLDEDTIANYALENECIDFAGIGASDAAQVVVKQFKDEQLINELKKRGYKIFKEV